MSGEKSLVTEINPNMSFFFLVEFWVW